jgi:hypothetical protein
MALDPQSKDSLSRFTLAAKKIIYAPERMKQFMTMLGTPDGAITAVQSVLAVIEKSRHIPPQVVPLLAVNCYLVMVDVAQEATKVKPDPGVMKQVIAAIMSKVQQVGQQNTQQPQQIQQPRGIINQGVPA